jgi:hypothetical protein
MTCCPVTNFEIGIVPFGRLTFVNSGKVPSAIAETQSVPSVEMLVSTIARL